MLLWLTEGLLLLTLPASVGMAVVADDFVRTYLGPQWEAAIGPLRILSGYAAFRAVVTLLPQVLTMRRETRFLMYNAIGRAVALPVAFLIGSRWGPTGIALGWVIVYPLFMLEVYRRTFRNLGLSVRQYVAPLWATLRGTMIMLGAVVIVRTTLDPAAASLPRLAAQVGVGAAMYLIAGLWPQRERLRRSLALFSDPRSPAIPNSVFK
jgi:PST family polysaccharide transporter